MNRLRERGLGWMGELSSIDSRLALFSSRSVASVAAVWAAGWRSRRLAALPLEPDKDELRLLLLGVRPVLPVLVEEVAAPPWLRGDLRTAVLEGWLGGALARLR